MKTITRPRGPFDAGLRPGDYIILAYLPCRWPIIGRIVTWWRKRKAAKATYYVVDVDNTSVTIEK